MLNKRVEDYTLLKKDFNIDDVNFIKRLFSGALHNVGLYILKNKEKYVVKKSTIYSNVFNFAYKTFIDQNSKYSELLSECVLNNVFPNFPILLHIDADTNVSYEEYAHSDLYEWILENNKCDTFFDDVINIIIQSIISIIFLNTNQKINHNDIKCENILLKEYPYEFGIEYYVNKNLSFAVTTNVLCMITDFDMVKPNVFQTVEPSGRIPNLNTILSNFYKNTSITQIHLYEYSNKKMFDIMSFLVCLLNVLNNSQPTSDIKSKNNILKIQEILYPLVELTLRFTSDNQLLYLKVIKKFFEYNEINFNNKKSNIEYQKFLI